MCVVVAVVVAVPVVFIWGLAYILGFVVGHFANNYNLNPMQFYA